MRQDISDTVLSDLQCGRAIYRTLEGFLEEIDTYDDDEIADVYHGNYDDSIDVTSLVLYTFGPAPGDQRVDLLYSAIHRARAVMHNAAHGRRYISRCYGGARGFIDMARYVQNLAWHLVPSPEVNANRHSLFKRLNTIVGRLDSSLDLYCEIFGSFASQLYTESSDLDLSLEGTVDCGFDRGQDISEVLDSTQDSILEQLASTLHKNRKYDVQGIINGRIKVLKVYDFATDTQCDICVSQDCTAWPKSQMLLCLNMIDEKFRLLLNLVMAWADTFDIKDGAQGKLNSYTLTLLVVFHLQTRPVPVLPSLKCIMPGKWQGLQSWNRFQCATGGRSKAIKTMAWKSRVWAGNYGGENEESLLELFISFMTLMEGLFQTWNDRHGQSIRRFVRVSAYHSCMYMGEAPLSIFDTSNQHSQSVIFVEDPFDKEVNSGRSVCRACVGNVIYAAQNTLKSFQECWPSQFIDHVFGYDSDGY